MKAFAFFLLFVLVSNPIAAYRLPSDDGKISLANGDALLKLVLHEAIDNNEENESFTDVTSKEQLWRFAVGEGDRLTMGDRFICLRSYKDDFVYGSGDRLRARGSGCYASSRIEVEFVQGNQVTLMMNDNLRYLSCAQDGSIRITDWKDDSAIFQLRIDADEDELILYNPAVAGTLSVMNDGSVNCNGFESDPGARFSGWKIGTRESWSATDEWQLIATLDNRYSSSKTDFTYVTSVGIERSRNSKASVAREARVESGPDMYEAFIHGISPDTDVAWTSTPPNVWAPTISLQSTTTVKPHSVTKLYQAVGHYGIFTIFTNYIQARDEETDLEEGTYLLKID